MLPIGLNLNVTELPYHGPAAVARGGWSIGPVVFVEILTLSSNRENVSQSGFKSYEHTAPIYRRPSVHVAHLVWNTGLIEWTLPV